jgi:hypothetical protein
VNAKGSTRNHPIPRAVVERIGSLYYNIAKKYSPKPIPTSPSLDRHVATTEDVAIFLAITAYITQHQGEDRAMPSRRLESIWNAMYESEEVSRPHCVKRIAAIRNYLSDMGLIDWQDERYWSPDMPDRFNKETRKGVCCRYSLDRKLMEELGFGNQNKESVKVRESTAGTDADIYPLTPEIPKTTTQHTPIDPQILRLLGIERPVIRPTRMGCASDYWGREAA